MARLFLIVAAILSIASLAFVAVGDADSHRDFAGDIAGERVASMLAGVETTPGSASTRAYFETIAEPSSDVAPEQGGCDPAKGHSCASHLMNLGQSTTVFGFGLRKIQTIVMFAAPDDRESVGLFRPPIKLS